MKERRQYVRVIANLELRIKEDEPTKAAPEKAAKPEKTTKQAKSKDVGGGGVRFISNVRLAAGTPLKMEVDVPGARHSVDARSVVVWSKKIDESSWEVATEFTDIEPRDRDKIMRHVYYSQKG